VGANIDCWAVHTTTGGTIFGERRAVVDQRRSDVEASGARRATGVPVVQLERQRRAQDGDTTQFIAAPTR
jgi:hypothetical protein